MKRIVAIFLCLMMMTGVFSALAENAENKLLTVPTTDKVVLCFSATDNTWGIAEKVASLTGSDILRIEAEIPYTADDLNYNDTANLRT